MARTSRLEIALENSALFDSTFLSAFAAHRDCTSRLLAIVDASLAQLHDCADSGCAAEHQMLMFCFARSAWEVLDATAASAFMVCQKLPDSAETGGLFKQNRWVSFYEFRRALQQHPSPALAQLSHLLDTTQRSDAAEYKHLSQLYDTSRRGERFLEAGHSVSEWVADAKRCRDWLLSFTGQVDEALSEAVERCSQTAAD